MNSENVDTESSLQMHKLPSVLFLRRRGVGLGYTFLEGRGRGGRVHSAQGTTQFVDHKLTRIIQKELQSLITTLLDPDHFLSFSLYASYSTSIS